MFDFISSPRGKPGLNLSAGESDLASAQVGVPSSGSARQWGLELEGESGRNQPQTQEMDPAKVKVSGIRVLPTWLSPGFAAGRRWPAPRARPRGGRS